jgi:hypothetical protein
VLHGSRAAPALQAHAAAVNPWLSAATKSLLCLLAGGIVKQVLAAVQEQWQRWLSLTELQQQQQPACDPNFCTSGFTFVVFGGLTPDGLDLGGAQLSVLWLAPDVSWGTWLMVTTSGPAPAPRAYSCCEALPGGTQVLVYGGLTNGSLPGTVAADVSDYDGHLLLCVYLLDANSLRWIRQATRPMNESSGVGQVMAARSTCPGPRKLALSCCRVSSIFLVVFWITRVSSVSGPTEQV